jgi:glycosyltransferase involved in cell wall biosynthesis
MGSSELAKPRSREPNRPRPLVSICIPTYNGAEFVDAALSSAVAQDYPEVEIVVVDDASTDGTVEKLQTWEDRGVRTFLRHRNRGHVATWNESVARANGSLIKFLHQDDELHPTCVTRMVQALDAAPDAALVFSHRRIVFEDLPAEEARIWLERAGRLEGRFDGIGPVNRGQDLLRQWVDSGLYGNWVGEPSAVMVRRTAIERVGGFGRYVEQATDMDLWARIMAHFDVCFIGDELATFRVHKTSLSFRNRRTRSSWLDRLWTLEALNRDADLVRALPQVVPELRAERRQAFRSTLRLGRIRGGDRVPTGPYLRYAWFRLIAALRPAYAPFPRL